MDRRSARLSRPVSCPRHRDPAEEVFLERTGQGLLWGAIGAAIVALLLGLALSRNLTRPLRRLTAAIHNMAAGDLEQHVDIRSQGWNR